MSKRERINELKRKLFNDQGGKCAHCGRMFHVDDVMELAHLIPQRKWCIKKWGEEIIHHELNMQLTHAGECNSGVQLSPNKTRIIEEHIEKIREAIENGSC